MNHWNWGTLFSCNEPYTDLLTQIFYANLRFSSEPFKVTSYICGQEIDLSLENLANWFELTNDGEESYPLRSWPSLALGTADHYKNWFDRQNHTGAPLYSSALPSIHRLVFLFINNILTPKSTIKTNMEHGACYYLRHLLSLDDKTFNFPYIILRHIRNASRSRSYSLPYGHLIHRIFQSLNFVIPNDIDRIYPINLVNELPNIGWKENGTDGATQLPIFTPDTQPINQWIFHHNAVPNQYWDPDTDADPNLEIEPHHEFFQPPLQDQVPQNVQDQMNWMVEQMRALTASMAGLTDKVSTMDTKFTKKMSRLQRSVNAIDGMQEDLIQRWVSRFGTSTGSSSRARDGDEDDDDDDVDHDGDSDN